MAVNAQQAHQRARSGGSTVIGWKLDRDPGPKLLSVFGGKITTARALAEEALGMLGIKGVRWTASAPLPSEDQGPS